MALTGLHTASYETELKDFIAKNEGSKTKVYTDGVPTIGAGYALSNLILSS